MGNDQSGACQEAGDKPPYRLGDVVRALNPISRSMTRGRVIELRRFRLRDARQGDGDIRWVSRWVVKVRWCCAWTDEDWAVCVVDPALLIKDNLPVNEHLTFVQIIQNPFPLLPLYQEIFYMPLWEAVWMPGFIIEENEFQYSVLFQNMDHPSWKRQQVKADKRMLGDGTEPDEDDDAAKLLVQEKKRQELEEKENAKKKKVKALSHADSYTKDKVQKLKSEEAERKEGKIKLIEEPEKSKSRAHGLLEGDLDDLDSEERKLFAEHEDEVIEYEVSEHSVNKDIDFQLLDGGTIYELDDDAELDMGALTRHAYKKGDKKLANLMGGNKANMNPEDSQREESMGSLLLGGGGQIIARNADSISRRTSKSSKFFPDMPDEPEEEEAKVIGTIQTEDGEELEIVEEQMSQFVIEWVNKSSNRVRKQNFFWNFLYSRYLRGDYEETADGRCYAIQSRAYGEELNIRQSVQRKRGTRAVIDAGSTGGPKDGQEKNDSWWGGNRVTKDLQEIMAKEKERVYSTAEIEWKEEREAYEELARINRYHQVVDDGEDWHILEEEVVYDVIPGTLIEKEKMREQAIKEEKKKKFLKQKKNKKSMSDEEFAAFQREEEEKENQLKAEGGIEERTPNEELMMLADDEDKTMIQKVKTCYLRRPHPTDEDDIWDSFMIESWVRYRFEYRDVPPASNSDVPPSNAPGADYVVRAAWVWGKVAAKDDQTMTINCYVSGNMAATACRFSAASQKSSSSSDKDKKAEKDREERAERDREAGVVPITIFRDQPLKNQELIRYYWDRVKRYNIDSFHRYTVLLAKHDAYLVPINRGVGESAEGGATTNISLLSTMPVSDDDALLGLTSEHPHGVAGSSSTVRQSNSSGDKTTGGERASQRRNSSSQISIQRDSTGGTDRNSLSTGTNNPRPSIARASSAEGRRQSILKSSLTGAQSRLSILHSIEHPAAARPFQGGVKAGEEGYGVLGYSDQKEDGNSLYRAFSLQLYGTPENFMFLKAQCIRHIAAYPAYYSLFLDINFEYYMLNKRRSLDAWNDVVAYGDHLDIQAICELYDVRVHVYSQIEISTKKQPVIMFYNNVQLDNKPLPLIVLSYNGHGHYDCVKKHEIEWPLLTPAGWLVCTRSKPANIVLKMRQAEQAREVERYRVEEARRSIAMIEAATAAAPIGKKKKKKKRVLLDQYGDPLPPEEQPDQDDDSLMNQEEDLLATMAKMNRQTSQLTKPLNIPQMEYDRSLLPQRELVLCTYVGEVLFDGPENIQTQNFLDVLASAKIDIGDPPKYFTVHQTFTQTWYHDQHMESFGDLVIAQSLEGVASLALYSMEDGAGGATTETGEGLRVTLPRVVVMYPYFPEDAHLTEEAWDFRMKSQRGKKVPAGTKPLMCVEGMQPAVEEFVRLVRKLARSSNLVRTSLSTWLPPS